MKFDEFRDEYLKLEKRYNREAEFDPGHYEETFGLLKQISIFKFRAACDELKRQHKKLPDNIVPYILECIDRDNERKLTGDNGHHKEFCAACQNTGFITCSMRTGGPVRFPVAENPPEIAKRYGKYDDTFVKTCLCPKGEHMAQGSRSRPATQEECRQAAILNGGPQKQVYVNERRAEGLMDMRQFDPPKPKPLRPMTDFPEECPF